mmetsp:Transcript_49789/g.107842  ORF Transcript_49789/g.107842 Transcript_49789/m.107842 type:complete len:452 (+) Transcript_49789:440-1795(+)
MRESRMRLRTTQMASCSERFASSTIILLPPRTNTVTAREFGQSSITVIRSFVVPKASSCTWPAVPSFSGESSEKRGTMRALHAIAMSSSSTPPTQRMAGKSFCISKWFASSSKPHWHTTRLAPHAFTLRIMSRKYSFSAACMSVYACTVSSSSLCLVLGLGGSNGQVSTQILASVMSLRICGCDMSLSITMPRTSFVSSSRPPTLPSILIRSRFTSRRFMSATERTASTATSAIGLCERLTILEESVVMATPMSASLDSSECSNVSEISASLSTATSHARSNPSAMRIGWMPRSSNASAFSSSAPASTTTPVVPSPISSSCDLESSTSSLPIWFSTFICSRMVAPSLVMHTSPSGLCSILSMPLGPSDVFKMLQTAFAAIMLAFCAARPCSRPFFAPSLMMMKGRPYSSKARLMVLSFRPLPVLQSRARKLLQQGCLQCCVPRRVFASRCL